MPGFPDRQSSTIFNKLRRSKTALSLAIAGAAFGLASCAKGVEAQPAPAPSVLQSAEQVPSASPSASEATPSATETASNPGEVSLSELDGKTFKQWYDGLPGGSEGNTQYEQMSHLIIEGVDIPSDEWNGLSKEAQADRANRYFEFIAVTEETSLGDGDGANAPEQLEAVDYTTLVDQKFVDSLDSIKDADGALTKDGAKLVQKVEMIRRIQELGVGSPYSNSDSEKQVQTNLATFVYGEGADLDFLKSYQVGDDGTPASANLTKFSVKELIGERGGVTTTTVRGVPVLSINNPDSIRKNGEYGTGKSSIKLDFIKTEDDRYRIGIRDNLVG